MTIVLEHQFWDIEVTEEQFSVTLSFTNKPERLTIPFEAVTAFADPAVKFGLQFQPETPKPESASPTRAETPAPAPAKPAEAGGKSGEVVTLDAFRKK